MIRPRVLLAALATLLAVASLSLLPDVTLHAGDESRTYESIKRRDMLCFDFMLVHPDGSAPAGVTPEEAEEIEQTVTGGLERLVRAQDASGVIQTHKEPVWLAGSHALATWTLIACGKKTTDPAVEKAVAAMLRLAEKRPPLPPVDGKPAAVVKAGVDGLRTYEAGLVLLALHALADRRYAEELATAEAKENEKRGGPAPEDKDKPAEGPRTAEDVQRVATELQRRLRPEEVRIAKAVMQTLVKRQCAEGQWTYLDTPIATGDTSNMHFAMLGLLSAFRIGLKAPPDAVLARVEKCGISSQQTDGPAYKLALRDPYAETAKSKTSSTRSPREVTAKVRGFKYQISGIKPPANGELDDTTLSMSCASVICLSITRFFRLGGAGSGAGNRRVEKIDAALVDGLAWLSHTLESQLPGAKKKDPEKKDDPKDPEAKKAAEDTAKAKAARENNRAYPSTTHWQAYTMLAVERAAILTGNDFFGRCEWYPVGARFLLGRLSDLRSPVPDDDAGGKGADRPAVIAGRSVDDDLCMYLLFLKGYLDKAPKKPAPSVTGRDRGE